jgi:hypothetical protein
VCATGDPALDEAARTRSANIVRPHRGHHRQHGSNARRNIC